MDRPNTIFGNTCSIFLRNFQNSEPKYLDIFDSYTALKEILISGEMEFPKITLTALESFDNSNITFQKTYLKLTEADSNGVATGFSRIKIYEETDPNIDVYLDELSDEYKNIVLQLQCIYDIANKNIDRYRLLLYLLTDISDIFVTKSQFNNFDFYNSLFRFLYKKQPEPESNIDTHYKNLQLLSIPSILAYNVFRRLYSDSTDSLKNTMNEIYDDPDSDITQRQYLTDHFINYLNSNIDTIGIDISNYINNNILMFGRHTSQNVFLLLRKAVESQIPEFISLLQNIGSSLTPNDFIYRICSNTITSNCNSTALDNMLSSDSYLWNLDKYTNYNEVVHDKFYQIEDVLLSNAVTYLNKHIGEIKQIINIPIKFTAQPIFFINSFSIIFSKYALNYMQDTDIFTYADLSTWLDNTLTTSPLKLNNIQNYFLTHPLQYYRKDLNLNTFLILQEYISNLIEHDDFKQLIMNKFIPKIKKTISQEYKIEIDWYQNVDKILYLIKLVFANDLLSALNGNSNKLFYTVISNFDNILSKNITTAPLTLTKLEMTSAFEFERTDTTKWFNLLNSYFKNAIVSKYIQKYMSDTYSL